MKKISSLVAIAMIFVSLISPQSGLALSDRQSELMDPSPNCEFHPTNVTVSVNETVDFVVDHAEPGAVYAWNFRDGTSGLVGTQVQNVWDKAGDYIIHVSALLLDGHVQYCTTHVYVVDEEPASGEMIPADGTLDPIDGGLSPTPLGSGEVNAIVGGDKDGDQNFDIGTSGDNNTTTVTIEQPEATTPAPTTCSENDIESTEDVFVFCEITGDINITVNPTPEYHETFWDFVGQGIKDWLARH